MPEITVRRDEASAAFFDAAAEGRLLIKRCASCGHHAAPRVRSCRRCGTALDWAPASGQASLVTWSFGVSEPAMAFGWVELAEGPWMEALLADPPPDGLREGLPLRVEFIRRDDEHVPAFRPA